MVATILRKSVAKWFLCLTLILTFSTTSAEANGAAESWSVSTANSKLFRGMDIERKENVPASVRPSGPIPETHDDGTVTPGAGDNREEQIIDETFKVRRGEHVIIDNKILRMVAKSGNQAKIQVLGNLEIRNSVIFWEQLTNDSIHLEVGQGGVLTIVNSYGVQKGPAWWTWDFLNGSTINLDRAHLDVFTTAKGKIKYNAQNYSISRISLFEKITNSSIVIKDSVKTDLEIFTPKGSAVDISVPPSRSQVNWKLTNFYPKTIIDISDSQIGGIALTLTSNSDLTIRDFKDGQIGLVLDGGNGGRKKCSIDGFGDPNSLSGIKVANQTWELDCIKSRVTFINSNAVAFWFAMWGNIDFEVSNSRIIDPSNAGCGARLTIRNSGMDFLRTERAGCGQNDTAKTYVANSRIMQGADVRGKGSDVWLFNTKLGGGGQKQSGLNQIEGGTIEVIDSDTRPW